MKKVCHITSAHKRYDVRIFEKQCTSLAKNGYDVTLVVNDNLENETKNNVKIVSTQFLPKNRIDRFANSCSKILEKALLVDADIYQIHDPDLLPVAKKLKKAGKKVIFDSHEDVPAQILDKEWIPKPIRKFISVLYGNYENNIAKSIDGVISVTPHIIDRFIKINKNTMLVTNYPIIDENDIKEKIKTDNKIVCFAGGISEQWMHENIILAIKDIEGIKYIMAGQGSEKYLNHLKSLPGWNNVEYLGKVPHNLVNNIYNKSEIGFAINYSTQAKKEGTLGNTKLFEIMQNGLPVICSDYKLWKEIIIKYNCGICVDPNNIDEIKKAVEYLLKNTDIAYQMGQNGRKAVLEHFNWSHEEKKLLILYSLL